MTEKNEFEQLADNLFSKEELMALDHLSFNEVDIEELKKTGDVTVSKAMQKDGTVREIVDYKSFDKKVSFSKTIMYRDTETHKINSLNELMQVAIESENYEEAAVCKAKIEALTNTTK